MQVRKIDAMFSAAVFAVKECAKVDGCHDYQHTPCLLRKISEYFNRDDDVDIPNKMGENRLEIHYTFLDIAHCISEESPRSKAFTSFIYFWKL